MSKDWFERTSFIIKRFHNVGEMIWSRVKCAVWGTERKLCECKQWWVSCRKIHHIKMPVVDYFIFVCIWRIRWKAGLGWPLAVMGRKCEKQPIFLEEEVQIWPLLSLWFMWTLAGKICKRKAAQGDLSLLKLKEARQLPKLEREADLTHREAQEIVKRLWKHTEMWGRLVIFQYLSLPLLSQKYTKVNMLFSHSGKVFHLHHLCLV